MKITVIGQWGAYPKAGDATAGYLLEDGEEKILIDCGSGVLSLLQHKIKLSELTGVFITHRHHDHIADLGSLQYACLIDTDLGMRQKELPIRIAGEPVDGKPNYKDMRGSQIITFLEDETFQIGNLHFSFLRTVHDTYCLAVKVVKGDKVFVYTADTAFHDSLIPFCAGADVLIAETSFYSSITQAIEYGHMNTTEVGTLAKEAKVKKLVLTHLPHFGNIQTLPDEVRQVYPGKVTLAWTGLEIE